MLVLLAVVTVPTTIHVALFYSLTRDTNSTDAPISSHSSAAVRDEDGTEDYNYEEIYDSFGTHES